jgi:RimJ/RimL family protein N-acetyltransferase
MIYLETSRLQLRDWDETDLEPFSRLNADEKVMQLKGRRPVCNMDLTNSALGMFIVLRPMLINLRKT